MKLTEFSEKYPDKTFGVKPLQVCIRRKFNLDDYYDTSKITDEGWFVYLDHSCDEWNIGDLDKAKQFKTNLEEAITYCIDNK